MANEIADQRQKLVDDLRAHLNAVAKLLDQSEKLKLQVSFRVDREQIPAKGKEPAKLGKFKPVVTASVNL